ncbi:hypothetical protein JOB18_026515 [Solea senegalensis]|uniref:Uncharacterized protein n=1 Tax=Solea senegalensis TaxID=28829 RepID=A0AAV6SA86_SOLSE|nr:hypothetical protein JOB18_026515 [Solea senegalensis]
MHHKCSDLRDRQTDIMRVEDCEPECTNRRINERFERLSEEVTVRQNVKQSKSKGGESKAVTISAAVLPEYEPRHRGAIYQTRGGNIVVCLVFNVSQMQHSNIPLCSATVTD